MKILIFYLFYFILQYNTINCMIYKHDVVVTKKAFIIGKLCGKCNKNDKIYINSKIKVNRTDLEYGFLPYYYYNVVKTDNDIDVCYLLYQTGIVYFI